MVVIPLTVVVCADGIFYPFDSTALLKAPYAALHCFCTNVFAVHNIVFMYVSLHSSSVEEIVKTCAIAEMRPLFEQYFKLVAQFPHIQHLTTLTHEQEQEPKPEEVCVKQEEETPLVDALAVVRRVSTTESCNMDAFTLPYDADMWDIEMWGPEIISCHTEEDSIWDHIEPFELMCDDV